MVEIIRWTCFVMVIGLAVVIGSIISATAGAPDLYIEYPTKDLTVESDTITFYGRVAGTGGASIESVKVDGVEAEGNLIRWKANVSLDVGENQIKVVAKDEMGDECTKIITVSYQAPTTSPTQTLIDHGTSSAIPTVTPTLTVSISITSIPSGATVYLDDFYKGTTPIRENVTVGHHKIKVTKEGYHSFSEPKKIRRGNGEPEEWIIELKPLTGSIYISSTPSGASVYLDSVDMKAITPCMLKVVVGPNTIKLTESGYFDAIRNVSVSADGLLSLHVTLRGCGYIDISSDPPGAKVYIDGNYTGETPKNICKVVVGDHTIKLTKSDYDDEIRNVSVSVGETLNLHEKLTGYGSLCISSNPSGASVYIDGNCMGETPFENDKVVVGSHTYKLTKRGYADVVKIKHVSAGKLTTVDESLSLLEWLRALIEGGAIGVVIAGLFALPKWIIPRLSGLSNNSKSDEKER